MRKKVALSITCVVMVCVLLASLTSCMKIGMKQNAIESRLKESGATISYERTTPITKEAKGCVFEDLIRSTKVYTRTVDRQVSEVTEELFIIFCGNENACKTYLADNKSDSDKWISYRYDRIVMCGYYELLSIARNY
jgi:hypothetical protein